MEAGAILKHTETIRAQLAKRFANDPKGELDCWVMTAQQREAMVVEVYKVMNLERRVPDQTAAEAPTVQLVRETIASIWAQETSHASLMAALRKVDDPGRLQVAGEQGTLEGLMTSWATSNGLLGSIARVGIGVARVFNAAPAFTAHLGSMSLAEFFRFSEELELTASNGYSRILELLAQLEAKDQPTGYGAFSHYQFATVLAEEHCHQAIFERLQKWLKGGGDELGPVDFEKAKRAIGSIAAEHLGVSRVRGLPTKSMDTKRFLEAEGDALISDAGLGALFERYGIPFRVAKPPIALVSS